MPKSYDFILIVTEQPKNQQIAALSGNNSWG